MKDLCLPVSWVEDSRSGSTDHVRPGRLFCSYLPRVYGASSMWNATSGSLSLLPEALLRRPSDPASRRTPYTSATYPGLRSGMRGIKPLSL